MAALVRVSDIYILLNFTVVKILIVVLLSLRDARVRDLARTDLPLRAIIIHSFTYHLI